MTHKILMKRFQRTNLPSIPAKPYSEDKMAKEVDKASKEKNKRDFDKRKKAKDKKIEVGDHVMVVDIHHRRATIERGRSNLQRDTGDVKKLKSRSPHLEHQGKRNSQVGREKRNWTMISIYQQLQHLDQQTHS